jgi:hypothetical protein
MHAYLRAAAPLLAALLLVPPAGLSAQCRACDDHEPRLVGEALSLGANALIGGMTAGLQRAARGGSFRDAFVAGAAGGALTYGGKRVAAATFSGAGLLGREMAAVGTSMSWNAAEGRGALSRVVLPVGPVRVYVGADGAPVHAKVDAATVLAAGYAATRPGARFDAAESLSSGALVFERAGTAEALGFNGMQTAGVVTVRRPTEEPWPMDDPDLQVARITGHERVHVVQYDQAFLLWSAPAERWLTRGAGWSRALHRWVDLGLNAPALAAAGAALPYDARPWEQEAFFLSRTRPTSEGSTH